MCQALSGVRGEELVTWQAALSGTRDGWEASWHRWSGSRKLHALVAVARDPEREPIGTHCPVCDGLVPRSECGRRRMYCSPHCQREANGRHLAPAAA